MNRTALPLHFDACLIVTWLVFLPKYALITFHSKKLTSSNIKATLLIVTYTVMLCRYVRSLSRMRAVDSSFSSSVNLMSSMVGSGHHHGSITSRIHSSNNRMQQQVTSRSFGIITDTISKMVNNKMESDKGNVRPPMMTYLI